MRVLIIRNTPDARVVRRRGRQNREFYREADIECMRDALAAVGYEVDILEGDATLADNLLRTYADRDVFAFNVAYGVQGECRYTHIPSLLELLGVPYLCSGPRAHTLALDKYVTKVLIDRAGLPTPAFQLLTSADSVLDERLPFPLVVKPQFESASFGLQCVQNRAELKDAVSAIVTEFDQPALAEAFVPGREVNCGILGNAPPTPLPLVELDFGKATGQDWMATFEAKKARVVGHICPPDLPEELTGAVQALAVRAFQTLGCCDCARIDFRIDESGQLWILELNSMAAIHSDGSYYCAAKVLGWSYPEMLGKLLEAALARCAG